MRIEVKGRYTLRGNLDGGPPSSTHAVQARDESGFVAVFIVPGSTEALPQEVLLDAVVETEISPAAQDGLASGHNLDELQPAARQELAAISSRCATAAHTVGQLIKYRLGHTGVNSDPIASRFPVWRERGHDTWKSFPSSLTLTLGGIRQTVPLDEWSVKHLQRYLDEGVEPFVALRHLHRAENEQIPWARWVEATIASELAVKEYLIRKHPRLEVLLLEVPSPPLGVLYGRVLREYGGFEATMKSKMAKGAEIRNKLLHRPRLHTVTDEEAAEYVGDVRFTIFELLADLYPDDPVVGRLAPYGIRKPTRYTGDSLEPLEGPAGFLEPGQTPTND